MARTPDSNAARRKANTAAVGQASKKIQAIADVRKTAGIVNADPKITARTIKEMRAGKRPETSGMSTTNTGMGMTLKTPITKTSGLAGREGKLGGQHAGGHAGH